MAIWQYSIQLVANDDLLKNRSKIPKLITEVERERLSGWQDSSKFKILDNIVSNYLSKNKSWSDHIKQWGDEASHCVQLFFEGDTFSEVYIRLDLRNLKREFLDLIIELAELLDASGLNDEGSVVEINLNNLKKEFMSSVAFKFVKDPQSFLDSLTD